MYLILAVPILIASILLFQRAAGSLSPRRLNMSSYAFYLLLVSCYIGANAVVFGLADERQLYKLNDPDGVIALGWAAIMWAMVAVPGGMLLANAMLFTDVRAALGEYVKRPVEPLLMRGESAVRLALIFATLTGAAALIYTLFTVSQIPLLNVFRGGFDASELAVQRGEARLAGSSDSFIVEAIELASSFLQIAAVAAIVYWRQSRTTTNTVWMVAATVLTVVSLTYNITKTSLLLFMSGLLVVGVLLGGRIRRSTLTLTVAAGSAIVVAMYVFYRDATASGATVTDVFINIVTGRVAVGQLISFYYCLDLFPRVFPHIGFASTGRLIHQLLHLPYDPDYGITVMAFYDPAGVDEGAAGHATSIFLGEAWANFGWWGLILGPVFVGFFIQACHIWFLRSRKTPLHIGLYAYITYSFTLTSGIKAFYYPAWLFQLAGVSLLIVALALLMRGIVPAPAVALIPGVLNRSARPMYRRGVVLPK